MTLNTNIIKTRYNSRSPGKYWIKVSDANILRDKALENQAKDIIKKLKDMKKEDSSFEPCLNHITNYINNLINKRDNVINKGVKSK